MARSSERALLKSSGPSALPSQEQARLPAIVSPLELSCHEGAANLYNIMAHCLHMLSEFMHTSRENLSELPAEFNLSNSAGCRENNCTLHERCLSVERYITLGLL